MSHLVFTPLSIISKETHRCRLHNHKYHGLNTHALEHYQHHQEHPFQMDILSEHNRLHDSQYHIYNQNAFGIPRCRIARTSLLCKTLLAQTNAIVCTRVGTQSSFTCCPSKVEEALAFTSFSFANTLIGTFGSRTGVVGRNYLTYPCVSLSTCSQRTIMTCPSTVTMA